MKGIYCDYYQIGDIVLLKKDEICPADILIMDMFDQQCTVNTQAIDDKSDEKIKTASDLMFCNNSCFLFKLPLYPALEPNNSKIKGNHVEYRKLLTGKFNFRGVQDSFKGLVKLKKDPIAQELTEEQFIMRGSKIQFTEWILGLVIEIGMQTYIYRKFKRPKIIYYNSTFMKKQFFYSAISIIFLIILSIVDVSVTEVNACLRGGFSGEDIKLVISSMLVLPLYYHAITEVLLSLYSIYTNKNNEIHQQEFNTMKRSSHLDTSIAHLNKDGGADGHNSLTLAGLKMKMDDKSANQVALDDCLSQSNDTRSIVDLCLTTHLVFNMANTLTTGESSITGIFLNSSIYQVEPSHLKSLAGRMRGKMGTLCGISLTHSIQKQQKIPSPKKGLQLTNCLDSEFLPRKFTNYQEVGHPTKLKSNISEDKGEQQERRISLLEAPINEEKQEKNQQDILLVPDFKSSFDASNVNNLFNKSLKKDVSLVIDLDTENPLIQNQKEDEQTNNQISPSIPRYFRNPSSNGRDLFNSQQQVFLFSPPNKNQNSRTALDEAQKSKDKEDIIVQVSNDKESQQIEDHEDIPTINNPSTTSDSTSQNKRKSKFNSSYATPNNIEIEMTSIKDDSRVPRQTLINNLQIEKFMNSLEFHKKNDHAFYHLSPKNIDEQEIQEEEETEAETLPKHKPLNQNAKLKHSATHYIQREDFQFGHEEIHRQQLSENMRQSVAKGIHKTIQKLDEDSSNQNGSIRGKKNSNMARSMINQMNSVIESHEILGSPEFVHQHMSAESMSYQESHEILEALLLCHCTRSFYNQDDHKIINRSFSHIEELQLQFGAYLDFTFEFSCYIEGEQFYVLKKEAKYFKYQVMTYFYFQDRERFCILINEGDTYSIYVKEEIVNISDITYLNESLLTELVRVCNHFRTQGNRIFLYCKKSILKESIGYFLEKTEQKENLASLFESELQFGTQFLTVVAIKEKTVPGLDILFSQLKEAKIKTWIATGEKLSKVIPICFSTGLLNKNHKIISYESDEYDQLAFQIRNMLQLLKDGFQKVFNSQKQEGVGIHIGTNLHRQNSNVLSQSSRGLNTGVLALQGLRKIKKLPSFTSQVRYQSRKSIVSGLELENQVKFSILVSGASFKEISNNTYLNHHFTFICYFAQSVIGYDMTPEQKGQLIKVINSKMNENYKTLFIGDTLADFSAFTDSNISAYKKTDFSESQNFPGIQYDRIENLLSLLLFHSRMVAEICEDTLSFSMYRGVMFSGLLFLQYQFCEINYSANNLVTILVISFLNMSIEMCILVAKKYRKYKSTYLTSKTLTSQFSTLQEFSNQFIVRKLIKIISHSLLDLILFYFFTHFLLINMTTQEGFTLSSEVVNYLEQYLILSLVPTVKLLQEYTFKIHQTILLSILLLTIPLIGFSISPILRQSLIESFILIKEPQYILYLLFLPLFLYSSNKLILCWSRLKAFPLIKSFGKLQSMLQDCTKESYFIKPKQFNIAQLIRQIFLSNEPDIILSSYILSESVNVREASMNKWTLEFKDNNIEMRFQSLYKKTVSSQANFVSSVSFLFIELFIFYRTVLYPGGTFENFNSVFYTIYFLGAFFLSSIQFYLCFFKKYQDNTKEMGMLISFIRILYYLIIINIANIYDSVPGILICIFLSTASLPLLKIDKLFFSGIIVIIIIVLREFNLMSSQEPINMSSSVTFFEKLHVILAQIEIVFISFLAFLLQKRNYEETERKNFQVKQTLSQATQQMKDTLSILLPRFIREKLYSGQNYDKISTNQGNVAILFCDITNFDEIMMQEGERIVKVLDSLFRQFDKSCQSNSVLKIETVGKTYMAAAGLRDVDDYQQSDQQATVKAIIDPVKRCIQVALEMQEIAKNTIWGNTAEGGKLGKFQIKIGINYGTVISGVIGFHKPQFSLIGDTVNTASRVCSTGQAKEINISSSSYQRVAKMKEYKFIPRSVEAKGKGMITTYIVKLKKSNPTYKQAPALKKIQEKPKCSIDTIGSDQQLPQRLSSKPIGKPLIKSSTIGHDGSNHNSHSQTIIKRNSQTEIAAEKSDHKLLGYQLGPKQQIVKTNNQIQFSSHNIFGIDQNQKRRSSLFDVNSIQNMFMNNEEQIESIKNAEKGLNCEHKIDMEKLTNHGLNLQQYDFKFLKSQYQEEKDDMTHNQSVSGEDFIKNDILQLSYWTGEIISEEGALDFLDEQEDLIQQFWTGQMDETQTQIKSMLKMIIIQLLLYTICLFFNVGESSSADLVLAIRSILVLLLVVLYAVHPKLLKIASVSLNRFRLVLTIIYLIVFAVLNIELWMASSKTSVNHFFIYNVEVMNQIIPVLIYEIYLIYFMFFRQRIFAFIHQAPVFTLIFCVMVAQNIIVDLIKEGVFWKIIFLQILHIFNSRQLFIKDLANFNTLKCQNDKNQQADKLVSHLLPSHILQRLQMNPNAHDIISEQFDKQTILFADIAGFTRYSDQNQPETVVKMLRTIFTEFDQKCQYHKVFKVYTIGDCYVILGNTNHETRNPPEEAFNVVMMAFQMIEILQNTADLTENQIDMRIGIHTGKIVGGLVGTQIVRYDIYGLDVMIANKMESNGAKGSIVVSEATRDILEEHQSGKFIFTEKGDVFIKQINQSVKTFYCEHNPL